MGFLAAKILVVDDEVHIRSFLKETLTRDGYQVVTAESGEAALEQLATREFDLVLLDLMMPGIGGMEVLETLSQQSPETVVILLTAHASLETSIEALRQGAHDYLFKPCQTVELRESVRTGLLKRQRALAQHELLAQLQRGLEKIHSVDAERPATLLASDANLFEEEQRFLQWNGLIVDVLRHVITLDGCLLELSPTEFNLLAYLVSEAPRVLSAQELTREVQGYENDVWEPLDTVRHHIYRIRQKIKRATGRTNVIQTIRGVGYTLSA